MVKVLRKASEFPFRLPKELLYLEFTLKTIFATEKLTSSK
jgi:hypothetical protein